MKEHFKRHKKFYYGVATGVALAGLTGALMKGRHAVAGNAASDGLERVTVRPFSFFSSQTNNIVTTIVREGQGHPGYITRCLETMIDYPTQGEAARSVGVHSVTMSRHLNGIYPDAGGFHFERVAA